MANRKAVLKTLADYFATKGQMIYFNQSSDEMHLTSISNSILSLL